MNTSSTLSTAPFEHEAMDYAFLRAEGIRYLERLASQQWTDFNAHDPGITILEQFCYALTDLGRDRAGQYMPTASSPAVKANTRQRRSTSSRTRYPASVTAMPDSA